MQGAYREDMGTWDRLRQGARRHPRVLDASVAAALCAFTLASTAIGPQGLRGQLNTGAILAVLAGFGALVARRRWPLTVLAVTVIAGELFLMLSQVRDAVLLAPLVALYTVADSPVRRRKSLLFGGLAVVALAVFHMMLRRSGLMGPENFALVALGSLAVAAGDASRSRKAYIAEVEERVRRGERDRELAARRQVAEERLRIARDLHDVLGHHLALINVQAGVADQVLSSQPDQARLALTHVRRASRAALDDVTATVGLLRQPGDPAAPVEPLAGLARLGELVESFRSSGLRVLPTVDGAVRPLPTATDLTAYRVIQESLTNVRKHAGTATTTIRVSYQPAALCLEVRNDGTSETACADGGETGHSGGNGGAMPAPGPGSGHGITGMRERVAAAGGYLQAGPQPEGGFRVSAVLPLSAAPDSVSTLSLGGDT
jgi:signal transduction histidine kinase